MISTARPLPWLTLVLALAACPAPKPDEPDPSTSGPADAAVADDAATPPGPDAGEPPDATSASPDAARPTACPFDEPARSVGLVQCTSGTYDGYTLFAPIWSSTTYLVDMLGRLVHTWPSLTLPGMSVQLLENGDLMRTAHKSMFGGLPTAGGLQRIAWDGSMVWDFSWEGEKFTSHHDFAMLPNGNVLILYWEVKTEIDVIALGLTPFGNVWPEAIVEIRPTGLTTGDVVWEWHVWDHLVPASRGPSETPELVQLRYSRPDFLHVNSIAYNAELDQIVLSSRNLSELWIIDHGTTTAEAASHSGGKRGKGGDLLYRWGHSAAWGSTTDQMLFGQHNVHWIAPGLPGAGHLLVFNNGIGRGFSTVDELVTPVDANGAYPAMVAGAPVLPTGPAWRYIGDPPKTFYANHISGAQRLPNGNTLVCAGDAGSIFEVTAAGATVWRYVSPVGRSGISAQGERPRDPDMFRAIRFPADHLAFAGRDLTPGDAIEDKPGITNDPALAGECATSDDCSLCCASVNIVGWNKLTEWMTPCICGTVDKPGPCAVDCRDFFCAPVPPAGAPDDTCAACTNLQVNSGACIAVRQTCLADRECLGFQTCRLGCP